MASWWIMVIEFTVPLRLISGFREYDCLQVTAIKELKTGNTSYDPYQ